MEERIEQAIAKVCMSLALQRVALQTLDGTTSSPNTFSGPIGKQLIKCETLPICKFEKKYIDLPVLNFKKLSKDQKYLYEISGYRFW